MKEKLANLMGIRNKVMLFRSKERFNQYMVFMEGISEEQEQEIDDSADENNNLYFVKDNKIIAKGKEIILYGKVDLNNPSDLYHIKKFNLINEDHAWIHSDLDWENGDFKIIDNVASQHPTFNPVKWFMYNHLLLGKPERVIVYKVPKAKYTPISYVSDN